MADKKAKEPDAAAVEATPSQIALKQAGKPKDDASDEAKNDQAAVYAAAKRKARWG